MIPNEAVQSIHSFKYLLNYKEFSLVQTASQQIMRILCDEYTFRCVYLDTGGYVKSSLTGLRKASQNLPD